MTKSRKEWMKHVFEELKKNLFSPMKILPQLIIKEFNNHFAFLTNSNSVMRRAHDNFGNIVYEEMNTQIFKVSHQIKKQDTNFFRVHITN